MNKKVQNLAVMFVDLSGYTALTTAHGSLGAFTIAYKFQQLATESLVGSAKVVEQVGDEILFACTFAEDLLSTLLNLRFRTIYEPNFLNIKAGLHYGEVLQVEDRLYGNTINIAARITSRALASEILCSADFKGNLPKTKQILFDSLGSIRFKNVMHPVKVFNFIEHFLPGLLTQHNGNHFYIDPVCHMLVNPSESNFVSNIDKQEVHFCSAECKQLFEDNPSAFIQFTQ